LILLSAGLVVFFTFIKGPSSEPPPTVELKSNTNLEGRFLETFRRTESFPVTYEFQNKLARENEKTLWSYGVFLESSPTAPFVQSLIKSLRPQAYPEGESRLLETKFVDGERLAELLDLLAIRYLVSLEENENNPIGFWKADGEIKNYNLATVGEPQLFETVGFPLRRVESDWNKTIETWWLEGGEIKDLPYYSPNREIQTEGVPATATVKGIESRQNGTEFSLTVDSDQPLPILAKMSYFPFWKAYEGGKEIPIYRAAPNLMVFEGRGEITLKYQPPSIFYIGYLFSFLTLAFLIYREVLYKKQKIAKKAKLV
jgi:hypothetical protein